MAKKETNDAKREEMKNLVAGCIARGWTPATLAAYFRFSSFSPFVNGKSMGTNDLRAMLGALASFADARASVEQHIAQLEEACIKAEAELLKQQAKQPQTEEQFLNGELKEYIKQYPERYTYANHLVQFKSGKEWSINRAQNRLDSNEKWLKALQKAVK